jgi:translation initiation factor 2 gamma subunit (eIF-2gamma)
MVPGRQRRRTKFERVSMRVIATGGIIGIATVLGAILVHADVAGWIVGLVIGVVTVVLAALLWSSRQL